MKFYLYNSAGFFIQLFPCTLMIFFPFAQETYRFRRKWIFTGMLLASAILALVFPVMLYAVLTARPAVDADGPADLYMLAVILLVLAAYMWLVRETVMTKFLVFFSVLLYGAVQYWLVNMLIILLHNTSLYQSMPVYTGMDVLLYLVTAAVLLPIEFSAIICPLKAFNQEIGLKTMSREFLVTIVSTAVYFVLMFYYSTVWRTTFGWSVTELIWLLPVSLLLIIDQALIYWMVFRESVRRMRDDAKRRAMEIQQLQYEKITGEIEDVRRMRHDLRHHYNSLNDKLEKGQLDEAREYLSEVIDTTVRRENEIYCRNMTVNGLLQYYVGQAGDAGIRCEVQAECGELTVESADLTVLFGNIMENAINACRKYPENRWISIQMGVISGSLAIEISNSCRRVRFNRQFQTEDGFSPAEAFQSDRAGGGYGLRSLAHIAQKYDGSARFRFNAETEVFTTRVRLNMNTKLL